MTQDSIDHLKMLCMRVLMLRDAVEHERKQCSSPLSIKKKTLSVRK